MSGSSFEARIVLRPRSTDETLDLALAYLRVHFRDFIKLFLVLAVLQLVPLAAHFFLTGGLDGHYQGQRLAAAIVFMGLAERVWTVFASRHLFASDVSVGAALKAVGKKFIPSLLSTLISTLPWLMLAFAVDAEDNDWIIGFGVLFVTAWFMVWATHYYFREVYHLEHLSFVESGKRTRGLASRRTGRTMGLVLITSFLRGLFIFSIVAGVDVVLQLFLQFEIDHSVVNELGVWLGWMLAGPYIATVRLFDYIDARTRREGWDIQVRFSAIAQRSEQERAKRLAA